MRRELCAWLWRWREGIPLSCALCGVRSRGGLCGHCRAAVCASLTGNVARCPRCDLALAETPHGALPEAAHVPAVSHPGGPAAPDLSCPDCTRLQPAFDRVVAAFDYQWPGELLIRQLKLQGRFGCAPLLAALLAQRCELLRHQDQPAEHGRAARQEEPGRAARSEEPGHAAWTEGPGQAVPPGSDTDSPLWAGDSTLVVAVPSSRHSMALRGYNPAAEVGRALARRLSLAWRPELLRRKREGRTQKGLRRHARQEGVDDLYQCAADVFGREILVVDDVMTTGSTMSACARVLKDAGASRVYGAVVARTPSRHA